MGGVVNTTRALMKMIDQRTAGGVGHVLPKDFSAGSSAAFLLQFLVEPFQFFYIPVQLVDFVTQ